jgi:arginase
MTSTRPLTQLQVIGVPSVRRDSVQDGQLDVLVYRSAGIYANAQVPYDYAEPTMPPRGDDPVRYNGDAGAVVADAVAVARRASKSVLLTGGNCHSATGVLGGLQDAHGPAARIGLIWFDAHGDSNTPHTTLTGSLGGMPVAVCAGLALPEWRERSHIAAPLPTDRIILVDVRNLDAAEEQLIRATDAVIAAPAPGFAGADLQQAIASLAARVDMIYLHIDADILDERYVPHHGTREPRGPDMQQVLTAIDMVMATGKVVALAIVSVYFKGESDVDIQSGIEMLSGALRAWKRHGTCEI